MSLVSQLSSLATALGTDIKTLTALVNTKATPADITSAVNNLVNASPTTLDTLKEIAEALNNDPNAYDTLLSAIGLRVLISDIVNDLTSTVTNKPLSAAQGKALKDLIDQFSSAGYVDAAGARAAVGAVAGIAIGDGVGNLRPGIPNQDYLVTPYSATGILHGGRVTTNVNPAKFNVEEGVAVFIDDTDVTAPVQTIVTFGPFVDQSLPNISTDVATYVGVDITGQLIQRTAPFTPHETREIAQLALIPHSNHTAIGNINTIALPVIFGTNQLHDLMSAIGPLNLSGNLYIRTSGLQLRKTEGVMFKPGVNTHNDPHDPHRITLPAVNPLVFRYRTSDSNETVDRTDIDPTRYEHNSVLTVVPPDKWTVQRVVLFQSGGTRIQWGQAYFDTEQDAIDSISDIDNSYVTEKNMRENGMLRYYIVVKQSATDLTNESFCHLVPTAKFGGIVGGGPTAIAAIQYDVDQGLSDLQKATARENIDAVAVISVGDTETDFAAAYNAAKV